MGAARSSLLAIKEVHVYAGMSNTRAELSNRVIDAPGHIKNNKPSAMRPVISLL